MRKLIVTILVATTLMGCACRKTLESSPYRRRTSDSLRVSNDRYDSIYINRWQTVNRLNDTVFVTKSLEKFRYRFLRDTVFQRRTDTIPILLRMPSTPTKENRAVAYTPRYLQWLSCIGVLSIFVITYKIFRK